MREKIIDATIMTLLGLETKNLFRIGASVGTQTDIGQGCQREVLFTGQDAATQSLHLQGLA